MMEPNTCLVLHCCLVTCTCILANIRTLVVVLVCESAILHKFCTVYTELL